MKEVITVLSTLIFYIAFSVFFGERSNKMRASANAEFKKKAEESHCVTDAINIKSKLRYKVKSDTNNTANDLDYYEIITFEYIANGKKYRFKRSFDNRDRAPYSVTVWYKKSNPKKRVVSCDDIISKVIWIVFLLPLVFGVILYILLSLFGL